MDNFLASLIVGIIMFLLFGFAKIFKKWDDKNQETIIKKGISDEIIRNLAEKGIDAEKSDTDLRSN